MQVRASCGLVSNRVTAYNKRNCIRQSKQITLFCLPVSWLCSRYKHPEWKNCFADITTSTQVSVPKAMKFPDIMISITCKFMPEEIYLKLLPKLKSNFLPADNRLRHMRLSLVRETVQAKQSSTEQVAWIYVSFTIHAPCVTICVIYKFKQIKCNSEQIMCHWLGMTLARHLLT
jgi:hypothetical protein